MKMTVNSKIYGGGYNAPEIEMYSMPIEGGFGQSDGLEDINGDGVVDENDKWDF